MGNAKGRGENHSSGKPSCPVGTAPCGGQSSDGGHVDRFQVLVSISDYFLRIHFEQFEGINIFKIDFFFQKYSANLHYHLSSLRFYHCIMYRKITALISHFLYYWKIVSYIFWSLYFFFYEFTVHILGLLKVFSTV